MKKKISSIVICTLLIATVVLPVVTSVNVCTYENKVAVSEIFNSKTEKEIIKEMNNYAPLYRSGGRGLFATLCTSDGPSISDIQLRWLLDKYIPTGNAHSTLIALTECYGGDMMKEFLGRPKTTTLSATSECEVAYYRHYDIDAARALKPGAGYTSDDVHDAGIKSKHTKETPKKQGPTASLEPTNPNGEIKSRHVLVYAGIPSAASECDNDQRDTIEGNFAGQQNTTVTTVGGSGTGGWDYPGTKAGLRDALKEIGKKMNDSEQFVFFVTDHGNKHTWTMDYIWEYWEYFFTIPLAMFDDMIYDDLNQPDCTIIIYDPIQIPFNYIIINDNSYSEYIEYPIDLDGDGTTDYYEYVFPIDEEILTAGENHVEIFTFLEYPLEVEISLGTGDIAKPVSPDAPTILGQTSGKVGVEYTYEVSAVDPEGDNVWYYIDWDDGTTTDWDGPHPEGEEVPFSHTWEEEGTYTIKAKAKDIFESESKWGTLDVTMPRNRAINRPFQWFLQNHPNLFPILQKILLLQRLRLQ